MALQYPENTENYKYKGTISFTAFEEKLTDVTLGDLEAAFKEIGNTIVSNAKAGLNSQTNKIVPGLDYEYEAAAAARAADAEKANLDYEFDAYKSTLNNKDSKNAFYGSLWKPPLTADNKDRVKSKSETTTLYLPPGLVFQDGVAYDQNFELGILGASALQGVREGRSIASSVLKGIDDAFESIKESLSGPLSSNIARVGAVRTARRFGGDFGEGLAQTATGVTVNPNKRTIMKGPNIRNFSFNFTLIPSSVSEAETIKKIITFFRTELYPEELRAGAVAVGYKVPRKFDIRIKYDTKEVATKILPCFLTGVQTTYNPSSMSFHKGGEFAEIGMTLNFVEERALSKQDIAGSLYDAVATEDIPDPDGAPGIQKGQLYQKYYKGGY